MESPTAAMEQPPPLCYPAPMPDDLYDRDILSWSEYQADLLRRLARGERVNDIDWSHIVEEIVDVGISELNAVRSYLRLMMVHLLKVHGWPHSPSADHWRSEVVSFQKDAAQRFVPSMRQRIDLARLYADAAEQLESVAYDGVIPHLFPTDCPFSLDALLHDKRATLENNLREAP
jgi:hypothetical protein